MTERIRQRTFTGLISPETALIGGFKVGEMSSSVVKKGEKGPFYIHNGFIPNDIDSSSGLHIIVAEKIEPGGIKKWYFGTFEGPAFTYLTDETIQKHQQMEQDVLISDNIVPGWKLESLIRETIKSHLGK